MVLFSIYIYFIRKFFRCHFSYQPHFNYYSIKASQQAIKTKQGSYKALASFLGLVVVSIIDKIDGEMKNSQLSLNCILSAEG